MSICTPSMPTVGEIARRLSQPLHRVQYVIRARGIQPCGWAGNARVFPDDAIDAIAEELERIDTKRDLGRGDQGNSRH